MDEKFSIPIAILAAVLGIGVVGCAKQESKNPKIVDSVKQQTYRSSDPFENIYNNIKESDKAHERLGILEREILPHIGPNPDPDIASRLYYNLAWNALVNKEYDKAVKYGEETLKYLPKSEEFKTYADDAHLILAKAYFKQNKHKKSAEEIAKGLKIGGDKKISLYDEAWGNCASRDFASELTKQADKELKEELTHHRAKEVIYCYLFVLKEGGFEPSEDDFSRADNILKIYGLRNELIEEAVEKRGAGIDQQRVKELQKQKINSLKYDINKKLIDYLQKKNSTNGHEGALADLKRRETRLAMKSVNHY